RVAPCARAGAGVLALLGGHRLPASGVFEHVPALFRRAVVPALADRGEQQLALLAGELVPLGQRFGGGGRLRARGQRREREENGKQAGTGGHAGRSIASRSASREASQT